MDKKESIQIGKKEENSVNVMDEALIETNKQKMVESIIQKWLVLQKTIKEEITLEEVILKHQENEFWQLKDYFKKYYSIKLESRKILEEINSLDKKNSGKIKDLVIEKDLEDILLDIYEPIKDLLFTFRNNYDYTITLVSLISENDKEEKISSLVELFCNQFYENILIPNPEQEELLLLIYKLLEIEISPMNSAAIDYFLNDDTFLGKFISSFLKRQEIKVFLSSLINPLIIDIENNSTDNYLGISLFAIKNFIKTKKQYEDNAVRNEEDINFDDIGNILLKNINKTSIMFKKFKKENEKKKINFINSETEEEEDEESDEENDEEIVENWNKNINQKNNEVEDKQSEINNNYEILIDIDYLEKQLFNENNGEIKNLYIYELEQIINEEDIFSNKGIIEVLKDNDFKKNRKDIINLYKSNFIFIKNKIDFLIQSLIDKIESIPYTVRCICKVIFLLLKKKFPSLNNYLKNSFIGKFIFHKCIFPILSLENKNILEPRILSINTKKCLSIIISVLSYAYKCLLFNYNVDTEKTIFNHYILELIPILNKFYEKLIDIQLPPVLDYLVSKTKINSEINIDNKCSNMQYININKENEILDKNSIYNYFHEHNDELLNLQCICFSFEDILFILSLIGRNIQAFSGLQSYTNFEKAYKYILQFESKIEENLDKDKEKFFVIFKAEKNTHFEKLIKQNKTRISSFSSESLDSELIHQRFKFCIKTVLKGLNLLNNKDYSYLNMAISSGKFFSALKYTLDDFGELSEVKNKIPLKWYGQYIFNNKDGLEQIYKDNDYSELYNEIYNEESNILGELKSISSTIITRDGMNIRCAEKILQKQKYDNYHIIQAKEFVKIDKFVEEEKIEVCMQTSEINEAINKEKENEKEKEKEKERNKKGRTKIKKKIPLTIVEDPNCPHKISKHIESDGNERKEIIPYHAYSIKDFISKFSHNGWGEEKLYNYVKPITLIEEDIKNGNRENEIYTSLKQYMSIVKKHIKKNKNIFNIQSESDCLEIANKIEDYIMNQMYIHVYPKEKLKSDIIFYNQTKKLYWITPEHLDIKKIYINQLSNAVIWIKKIDQAKSIRDKLYCISNAYNTMNNTIKFSSGKNDNAGQDELTPIFQYIIIKAQPQRIFSNINYIKCFLDDSGLTGELGFLLTQMESATCFIMDLDYEHLKITKEEFDKNIKEAEEKINLENKN